jgi:hypothetical protein
MDFKATAKRMGTAAAVAGGAVMAATSNMLQDPAYPIQQAIQAPDMKSAALAAGTAAITAGIVGRRRHFDESAATARHEAAAPVRVKAIGSQVKPSRTRSY